MAITSLRAKNVLIFKEQWRVDNSDNLNRTHESSTIKDTFELQFTPGINIFIGDNGVGKTSILKMIYAATQWSNPQVDERKTKKLIRFFSNNLSDMDLIRNQVKKENYAFFEVSDEEHKFCYSIPHKGILDYSDWFGLNISSVFIPAGEVLSHSKGLLALDRKYNDLPFDGTQIDIIANASLPEVREVPEYMSRILESISKVIGGTVIQENDIFFVQKNDGRKIDFSLEAEGLRKLGLLWKIIRNGLLSEGSILLWDEPESNLNPQLFPLVADILLELERNGIQVFVATHSYNLAKYFEIRRREVSQVLYHWLYLSSEDISEKVDALPHIKGTTEEVYSKSSNYLKDIGNNNMMKADEALLDETFEKGFVK